MTARAFIGTKPEAFRVARHSLPGSRNSLPDFLPPERGR
jgi:hypothetical protein